MAKSIWPIRAPSNEQFVHFVNFYSLLIQPSLASRLVIPSEHLSLMSPTAMVSIRVLPRSRLYDRVRGAPESVAQSLPTLARHVSPNTATPLRHWLPAALEERGLAETLRQPPRAPQLKGTSN